MKNGRNRDLITPVLGIVETFHETSLQGWRMRFALAVQVKCRQEHRAVANMRNIGKEMVIKNVVAWLPVRIMLENDAVQEIFRENEKGKESQQGSKR